jgi:DNA-binding MarR family transcriptional regulator
MLHHMHLALLSRLMSSTAPALRNPLEDLLGYQLRRASSASMAVLVRDLETCGLKPVEASVLLLIDANPGVTQSDIGRILGIQRANMAPMVASFDGRGLLRRKRLDGRSHGLEITSEGRVIAARARAAMHAHDAMLLAAIPGEALESIIRGLDALWRQGLER